MGSSYTGPPFLQRYRQGAWLYKFAWLPKRSAKSGQIIWLKKAWSRTDLVTGPGDVITEVHWLTNKEFTWYSLSEHSQDLTF